MQLSMRYVETPGSWGQENGVFNRAEAEDKLLIEFQSGPIATRDLNGVMPDQVIQAVIDQFKAQQRVESLRSRERSLAITKLQEAQHWEQAHQEQRNSREATVERVRGGDR